MFKAEIRGEIQTELRQFDGNLRLQTFFSDALQNLEIVFGNLLRFGTIFDVFAQVSEDRSDLLSTENLCRAKRVIERFAGHEPRHRTPYKRVVRHAIAQPLILRCCEQYRSHETHECIASWPRNRSAGGFRPAPHSKPYSSASCFSIFRGMPLARARKRGSRQSERFLGSYPARTADRSGFAAKACFTFPSSLRDGVEFGASSSARQLLCAKKTRENEPLRLVLAPQELPVIEPVASRADRVGERSINGQRPLIPRSCCRGALALLLEVGQMNESETLQRFGIRFFCELDCGVVALERLVLLIGSSACVGNFDEGREHRCRFIAVFVSMRSHNLQIGSVVSRRGLCFVAPVQRLRKIELRIRLAGVDIDRALPAINGLIAVPLALGQKPIIHQCIGVPWPMVKHLSVLPRRLRFSSRFDQAARVRFLLRKAARANRSCSLERRKRSIALSRQPLQTRQPYLNGTVVGIQLSRALERLEAVRLARPVEVQLIHCRP